MPAIAQDRDRYDSVALEDLPRLLPDMKFDKFEFEVTEISGNHGMEWIGMFFFFQKGKETPIGHVTATPWMCR